MVRRPNIYEVVFASVDTRAVLPQLIGSDVVKSGWESRDVMTDWRRHTCGSLCCLYVITYLLEKLFVDTWVVRRRPSDIGARDG